MWEFLQRLFGGEDKASKNKAKDRLRLILIQDRADLSPAAFEAMREDLIKVISNYMDIDVNRVEVSLKKDDDTTALFANIPIVNVKRSSNP